VTDVLSDERIAELIAERKHLPNNYRQRLVERIKPKKSGSHSEGEIQVEGELGSTFLIKTRQSNTNVFSFSVILAYAFPDSTRLFRLCRYNGRTVPHLNKIENELVYGFHIHVATQRYQEAGFDEDSYAKASNCYMDLASALRCMIEDCNLVRPDTDQIELL
jgi:hypothetical protein